MARNTPDARQSRRQRRARIARKNSLGVSRPTKVRKSHAVTKNERGDDLVCDAGHPPYLSAEWRHYCSEAAQADYAAQLEAAANAPLPDDFSDDYSGNEKEPVVKVKTLLEILGAAIDSRELASLLHEGEFATSYGGSVSPEHPVELRIKPLGKRASKVVLPLSDKGEKKLLSLCEPAMCGVNAQDVYEPKYRQALGLSADEISHNFEIESTTILDEINAALCPHTDVVLTTKLEKLNVYTAGGFFKGHTDHARASNFIGTLVLVLPSPFEGGELVVDGHGSDKTSTTFAWPEKKRWDCCLPCFLLSMLYLACISLMSLPDSCCTLLPLWYCAWSPNGWCMNRYKSGMSSSRYR